MTFRDHAQSFCAPAVSPAMKCCCMKKKSSTGGIAATIELDRHGFGEEFESGRG